jgi:acyl dehydratase
VTDIHSNSSSCTQNVTVIDNENPVITGCPSDIIACSDQGVSWAPPGASDNCSVVLTSNYSPGYTFPAGNTTVVYTATDPAGNTATCSFIVTVRTLSTDPTSASSNAPVNGICIGGSVTLSVAGGSLGTAADWVWYEDGCGNGSPIGTGASITVTPAFEGLHSYYVRAEGICNMTNCAAVSVLVGTYSLDPTSITTSAPGNSICAGNTITMTVNGGFLGTIAVWNWYSGSCGGTFIGTGPTITVTPSATTTYFVRAQGSCNTTACASVTVYRSTTPPGNPPPTIITAPNGICSGNGSTLVCQTVSGATYYSWSGPNGTTFGPNNSPSPYVTTVPTTTVTFGNLPNGLSGYDICVFAANGCGTSVTKCRYIRGRVQTAQSITGSASSCPNTSSVYSITSLPGADNYTWTITGAANINGGGTTLTTTSTSITVNFLAGWTSGTLSVYGSMSCGYNAPAKTITIISTPVVPGIMSGPVLVCPLGTYSYSIAAVAGATGYTWSTNVAGATMTGTGTSRSITFPAVIPVGSTVSVSATGSCGASAPRVKNIATGISNAPGFMTGPTISQCGEVGVSYSILPVGGATSYIWSASNGATLSSPNGLTSVTIDFPSSFVTSNVSVVAVNSCGNSAPQSKTVTGAPGQAGIISGNQAVCNGSVEVYSTTGATNATSYTWSIPAGAIILGPTNGNSINILWGATGGNVSVYASNNCGSGASRSVPVSIICRQAQVIGVTSMNATLYPNPAIDHATLNFTSVSAAHYKLNLTNVLGQSVMTTEVAAVEGINIIDLDLSTVAKGVYMLNIMSGDDTESMRLVVE